MFGPTTLAPAVTNLFKQSDSLHYAVRVYGWKGDAESKPDLSIEYVFYQRLGTTLRFFNKTKPQVLTAASVNKAFDGKRGAISTGMSIPLINFPPGEFELTARVVDRRVAGPTPTGSVARRSGSRTGTRGSKEPRNGASAAQNGAGTAEQKTHFFVRES